MKNVPCACPCHADGRCPQPVSAQVDIPSISTASAKWVTSPIYPGVGGPMTMVGRVIYRD